MNEVTVRPMVYKEAKACVDRINSNIVGVRYLIYDLYTRDGWTALGYKTWRECVTTEFKQGQSYLYYQLEAAQIERNISTNVENGSIPEGQLRPLAKLEPKQQQIAWAKVIEIAPEGKVTAALVSKVVKEMTKKPPKTKKRITLGEEVTPEFKEAWNGMIYVIQGLTLSKWKTMKREMAVKNIQILISIIQNQDKEEYEYV